MKLDVHDELFDQLDKPGLSNLVCYCVVHKQGTWKVMRVLTCIVRTFIRIRLTPEAYLKQVD